MFGLSKMSVGEMHTYVYIFWGVTFKAISIQMVHPVEELMFYRHATATGMGSLRMHVWA